MSNRELEKFTGKTALSVAEAMQKINANNGEVHDKTVGYQ